MKAASLIASLYLLFIVSLCAQEAEQDAPVSPDTSPRVLAAYNRDFYKKEPGAVTNKSETIKKMLLQASRDATILVRVANLENWITNQASYPKNATNADKLIDEVMGKFSITLNNTIMTGCPLEYYRTMRETNDVMVTELEFKLVRSEENKTAWKNLLALVPFNNLWSPFPMEVSIGTEDGLIFDTNVTRNMSPPFCLEVIPHDRYTVLALVVLLVVWIGFFKNIDLIRDTSATLRPDGTEPFSLARFQMAFWFLLVVTCYLFIWDITGQKDTITSSVLVLIGISSGTMVAATFVDKGKSKDDGRSQNLYKYKASAESKPVETNPATDKPTGNNAPGNEPSKAQPEVKRKDIVTAIVRDRQKVQEKFDSVRTDFRNLPADDDVARDKNLREQRLLEESIERLTLQRNFYQRSPRGRFAVDLLGDNGVIDFHRFQILAWTLVLGVIFLREVSTQLAMPDFNATLLGLMGISSGTYIGMKLPEGTK